MAKDSNAAGLSWGGLAQIQRLADGIGVLRRGAHLIPIAQLDDAHATALEGVFVRQSVDGTLHGGFVLGQHLAQAGYRHRFAGCE